MYKSNNLAVMDCETLGRWDDAIVLTCAVTAADLTKKYEFLDLVKDHTFMIKLNAAEQMKMGRVTDKPTMEWWQGIGTKYGPSEEAKAVSLRPHPDDRSVMTLSDDIRVGMHRLGIDPTSLDWCDRNLFDLRKVQHIIEVTCNQYDNVPWDYHHTFDVVSWLKGVGQLDRYAGVKAWELEGMVYHDPRHDAALDWLRIQKTMQQFMGLEIA